MKKKSLYEIILGFMAGSIAVNLGLYLTDFWFYPITITICLLGNMAYNASKDDKL